MLNMSDVFKMIMATVTCLNTDSKLFQNYAVLYPLLSSLVATVGLVLVNFGCHIKGRRKSKYILEEENTGHKSKQQEAGKCAVWGTS